VAEAVDIALVADAAALAAVQAEVDAFGEAHDLPPKAAYTLSLVVEELVTNVVNHAYGAGRPPGPLAFRMRFDDGKVLGEIEDEGPPFDPLAMTAPDTDAALEDRDVGGLGVHLVRTLCEDLRYERAGARNVLRFRLAA
jgi:serine/threonine-protein kinase RsbW